MHMTFIGPGPASANAPGYLTTGPQALAGPKTFRSKTTIAKSQAGLATLGDCRLLDLQNTNGSSGERVEMGWGYITGAIFAPVVIGHRMTSVAGFTKGGLYIGTRNVTTDTAPVETLFAADDGDIEVLIGDLVIATPGKGLQVKEGSNAKMGRSTLVGGAVTVANTSVTDASEIFVTSQVDGGTPGWLRVSARNAGQDFTITSSSGADTSTVAWFIAEPSP